eukprot:TRINITY_DN3755_c2_g1_i2.p1 TRINITY_DN3755_c2_g1~~TRINITY_DN3755_c2_g1_i2.p1  ORF type:complete len:457 (+),score=110.64 TRINITY_DN3755_c2_g1_i2:73-1371(+)
MHGPALRLREDVRTRIRELGKLISLEGKIKNEIAESTCLTECTAIAERFGGFMRLAEAQHKALRRVRQLSAAIAGAELLCAHLSDPWALCEGESIPPTEFVLLYSVPADIASTILSYVDVQTVWRARYVNRMWYFATKLFCSDRLRAVAESSCQHSSVVAEFSARCDNAKTPEELGQLLHDLSTSNRDRRQRLVPIIMQLRTKRGEVVASSSSWVSKDSLRADLVRQIVDATSQIRKLRERQKHLQACTVAVLSSLGVVRRPRPPDVPQVLPKGVLASRVAAVEAFRKGEPAQCVAAGADGEETGTGNPFSTIGRLVRDITAFDSRFANALSKAMEVLRLDGAECADGPPPPSPRERHTALPSLPEIVPAPPRQGPADRAAPPRPDAVRNTDALPPLPLPQGAAQQLPRLFARLRTLQPARQPQAPQVGHAP